MKFSRILSLICAAVLSVSMAFAQNDQADKLYSQGMSLQGKMTIKDQNAAIAKFTSAKKLYDSAAKKKLCDQAISTSRGIISKLKGGGDDNKNDKKNNGKDNKKDKKKKDRDNNQGSTTTTVVSSPKLEISNSSFELDLNPKTFNVTVNTNQDSWEVSPIANADGSSFVKVSKTSGNGFSIEVPQNTGFETRTQRVQVSAGDLKREVKVTQTGRHVTLTAKDQTLKFKEKGGEKKVEISCNSTVQYENNSYENWYIESQPDWVIITLNEKREKGIISQGVDKIGNFFLGNKKNDDNTMVKSKITITCNHLQAGTAQAFTGRQGDIIIRSGDATLKIHVTQLGKDSTAK